MKYREFSQHCNTDNPEYHGDGARYPKIRVRWWLEQRVGEAGVVTVVMRLGIGTPVPSTDPSSMFHPKAWKGWPLDPNDVVWPWEDYPVDQDGRGLSLIEVEQIQRWEHEQSERIALSLVAPPPARAA